MLKRTVKISLCLLLHVSVQSDHPQGAHAEPCQSYNIVELISKNTSLYAVTHYTAHSTHTTAWNTCCHNAAYHTTMYFYWSIP